MSEKVGEFIHVKISKDPFNQDTTYIDGIIRTSDIKRVHKYSRSEVIITFYDPDESQMIVKMSIRAMARKLGGINLPHE